MDHLLSVCDMEDLKTYFSKQYQTYLKESYLFDGTGMNNAIVLNTRKESKSETKHTGTSTAKNKPRKYLSCSKTNSYTVVLPEDIVEGINWLKINYPEECVPGGEKNALPDQDIISVSDEPLGLASEACHPEKKEAQMCNDKITIDPKLHCQKYKLPERKAKQQPISSERYESGNNWADVDGAIVDQGVISDVPPLIEKQEESAASALKDMGNNAINKLKKKTHADHIATNEPKREAKLYKKVGQPDKSTELLQKSVDRQLATTLNNNNKIKPNHLKQKKSTEVKLNAATMARIHYLSQKQYASVQEEQLKKIEQDAFFKKQDKPRKQPLTARPKLEVKQTRASLMREKSNVAGNAANKRAKSVQWR